MATKLDIINTALSYLGNNQVNTLDLSNPVLQAMSSIYDQLKPDFLAGHPWRFAMKWEELNLDPTVPEDPRYQYVYQLPPDYIQAWETYPWGNYQIFTDKLVYSNIVAPWRWSYVASITETMFPPYFTKLMSYGVAAECAMLVTENSGIASYWEAKTNKQRVVAQNRDFTAQPNPTIRDNRLWAWHFV